MVGYISKIKHQQDVDCNQVQQKAFAALGCGPFALAHAHGPQMGCNIFFTWANQNLRRGR